MLISFKSRDFDYLSSHTILCNDLNHFRKPQITVINADKPPTPPPVLPPVANVSSVDLPWSNSRPSTASPESAAPEQPPSLEMQPTSLSTELIPVVAAESQMIVYAGEHTA